MKDVYILAIETSCDETSVSIVKNGVEDIKTIVLSQIDVHSKYGGVIPEKASRLHIESITKITEDLFENSKILISEIDAIAVTYGPGLVGSLLIGVIFAKTLAFIYDKPLIPIHHIAGHIYANNLEKPLQFPLIALVVSGGHTDLILMKDDYIFEYIGGTVDDAVGEAFDKVARILGLSYPGGPAIDKLAKTGLGTYKLPLPMDDNSYNFSFSGLKSAVINLVHNEKQRGNTINQKNLATSFQSRVVEILTKKTLRALKEYNINNLVLAGGVSANSALRNEFTKLCKENKINLSIPSLKYCTDNATMIGAAGYYAYKLGLENKNFTVNPVERL